MKYLLLSLFSLTLLAYDLTSAWTLPQKQQLCLDNQSYCSNYCNALVKVNTCDSNSLQFTCYCSNGDWPTKVSTFSFPIEVQQCSGELEECVQDCLRTTGADRNTCSGQCKNLKQCGTGLSTQQKSFKVEQTPAGQANRGEAIQLATILFLIPFALL